MCAGAVPAERTDSGNDGRATELGETQCQDPTAGKFSWVQAPC